MNTVESTAAVRTAKSQVHTLLNSLPDDCTIEDVQYGLYVIERINKGIASIENGEGIPHVEVERRMQKWLIK